MTHDRERTGDWKGDRWVGNQDRPAEDRETGDRTTGREDAAGDASMIVETTMVEATTVDGITQVDAVTRVDEVTPVGVADDHAGVEDTATGTDDRWVKTEWVGDQGEGAPAPVDPDTMPEGDRTISGNRHGSGEQHWAGQDQARRAGPSGDRPLDQ